MLRNRENTDNIPNADVQKKVGTLNGIGVVCVFFSYVPTRPFKISCYSQGACNCGPAIVHAAHFSQYVLCATDPIAANCVILSLKLTGVYRKLCFPSSRSYHCLLFHRVPWYVWCKCFCVVAILSHLPTDPTKAFYQFAAQMRFDKKVKGLSLGQGQGVKATRLIEEASQKGTWVSKIPPS